MKQKITIALLALVLITALVSCDNISSIMSKMGENIAGTDETYVAEAAESVKVAEEDKTKAEKAENTKVGETTLTTSTKITYSDKKDGEGKELITVGVKTGEDGKNVQVIAIGETAVSLPDTITADIAGITSLLPPKDLKEITAVFDGAGKGKLVEKLNTPITDEATLEAAKGTATLIQGLMESASIAIGDDENNKAKELVDSIVTGLKESLDPEKEKDLTMGDVIVLQAITNIITDASEEVLTLMSSDKNDGTSSDSTEKTEKSPTALLDKANDSIMETVSILNNVSEATSAFSGLDLETLVKLVTSA